MIYLKIPPTIEASGCIFRRLIDGSVDGPRQQDGSDLYRLMGIRADDDAIRLFFLPREARDLRVIVNAGAARVVTRGRQLDVVPPNATLLLTALDSLLLLETGKDEAATRASCVARVRALRAAFPKIYAHVLPTISSQHC